MSTTTDKPKPTNMKRFLLAASFLTFGLHGVNAQSGDDKYVSQVETLDATIETLYSVISGDKGEERDWELFKYIFHPDAKLIPTGKAPDGLTKARYMTPQDYIDGSGKWLVANGFHEVEMVREVQNFGPIAQVFSSYEAFNSKTDEKPLMRGINSIQLLNDGQRWWVMNIYWSQESAEHPLPDKYISK